jgi:hypothetical protein
MNPDQQSSGRAEAMASDVAALPEPELLSFFTALDTNLRQSVGIGLTEIAHYIDQQGGGGQQQAQGGEGEMPMVQPEAETTFAPDDGGGEMAMAAGGRQRVFAR